MTAPVNTNLGNRKGISGANWLASSSLADAAKAGARTFASTGIDYTLAIRELLRQHGNSFDTTEQLLKEIADTENEEMRVLEDMLHDLESIGSTIKKTDDDTYTTQLQEAIAQKFDEKRMEELLGHEKGELSELVKQIEALRDELNTLFKSDAGSIDDPLAVKAKFRNEKIKGELSKIEEHLLKLSKFLDAARTYAQNKTRQQENNTQTEKGFIEKINSAQQKIIIAKDSIHSTQAEWIDIVTLIIDATNEIVKVFIRYKTKGSLDNAKRLRDILQETHKEANKKKNPSQPTAPLTPVSATPRETSRPLPPVTPPLAAPAAHPSNTNGFVRAAEVAAGVAALGAGAYAIKKAIDKHNAEEGKEFVIEKNDKTTVKLHSLEELRTYLTSMTEDEFKKYVTEDTNHFAEWVEHTLGQPDIAKSMRSATTVSALLTMIQSHIGRG